jgi:hypothetical protein
VPIVIHGADFLLTGTHHIGGGIQVQGTFQAWLGTTPLNNVVWIDDHTIQAVVPAGLAGDPLDLTLVGPGGRGTLAGAFRASPLTAPNLSVALTAPARVEAGQPFALWAQVANAGQQAVSGLGVQLQGATNPLWQQPSSGAFSCSAMIAATGSVSLSVMASAMDGFAGTPVTAVSPPVQVSVLAGPHLVVTPHALPAIVDVGQVFAVAADVTNDGDSDALAVQWSAPAAPGLVLAGPAAAAADVPAGTTVTFSWQMQATAAGPFSLTAGASAADPLASLPLSLTSAWAPALAQTPAALSVTSFTLRSALGSSTINRGQGFTASMTVANTGTTDANAVLPSAPSVIAAGGAAATTSSLPAAVTIPGGTSATFEWTWVESGTAAGTLQISSVATGTDAIDGAPISSATAQSDMAHVQAPAALGATVTAPLLVTLLQTFTVSLQLTNGGDGAVDALAPASLTIAGAATTVVSGPTPATATLAGHGMATFSWTCQANAIGAVTVYASASGTDANDGSTRFASATTSTAVTEVQQISSNPFADGTNYSYVFDFNGRVYLGPNKGGTGGVRMLPDGSAPETVTFTFNNDTQQKDANTYNGGASPYPSLGFTGCTHNTAQCGPDNEDGRGMYGSGIIAGTPWLIASGALSAGGMAHVYATTDTMAAPDFDYIGVKAQLGGEVQGTSAMAVFHDRIYMGFPSTKANRPFLMVVNRTPPVPGYVTSATDAINLQSSKMPGLGANGTPKNTAATQIIDAFGVFNDRLYLGNNGGWVRSTTNSPGVFQPASTDWVVATPSAAAYGAKTSVITTKLADLLPADRALPQWAVLNGKLYAARNTTAGPQIWACTPGADLGCDPGDWTLIAANTTGDPQLSQFNDPNNASITLLVATPTHLYVGFDDATDGIRLYRSSTTTPVALSDFQGKGGCLASAGPVLCSGLGGNGLGAGATRIFDGRALNYGGADYLYLTAGTGAGGVAVFRVPE